ncbi:MAG: EAL domain-containing protein [Shewanella sp.]
MTSLKRARFAISLLVTLAFMILVGMRFLPEWIFKWQFEKQLDYIVEHQSIREREIQQVMQGLFESLAFSCSENDRRLLQLPRYKSRYILLTGVTTAEGKTCSSLGQRFTFPLQDLADRSAGLRNTFFFRVGDFHDSLQMLVITYRHDQAVLFVVLSSESFYRLLDQACEDCFYIEFSFADQVALEIGDPNIKYDENLHKHTFKAANSELDITVFAGDRLQQSAYQELYKKGGIILFILAVSGCVAFFSIYMRRTTLTAKIKSAIQNKDFIPYYQPIIDVAKNKVVGAEVLIRWQESGEWIAPDQFICCAEDSGLIMPVTQVLFDKVLADIQRLPDDIWLSINISAKHFDADHLLALLSGINPEQARRVALEITERHPIKDVEDAAVKIKALHKQGFEFKLDDFGTGYGGVAYLQLLGIRSIKIDKMFIDTIGTADFKAGVLESIIAFGIESGYEMIAEGVETAEQASFLASKGIMLHQGYFYGKPKPLRDFIKHYQSFGRITFSD